MGLPALFGVPAESCKCEEAPRKLTVLEQRVLASRSRIEGDNYCVCLNRFLEANVREIIKFSDFIKFF